MMGDDVTAIDAESSPVPVAFPSFPRMRLTADSATRTGYPLDSLPRVWHSGKYLVPVERFCADVLPVHAIFLLGVHEAPDIVSESVDSARAHGPVNAQAPVSGSPSDFVSRRPGVPDKHRLRTDTVHRNGARTK